MRPRLAAATWAALASVTAALAGCGAQAELLGSNGASVFIAMDTLTLPGEEVALRGRLEGGDLLRAKPGHVVRFYRDGKLFRAAETDEDGIATAWMTPPGPGDYLVMAQPAATGFADQPPLAQPIRVTCRKAETPMVVVDLDRTVVASGFDKVLIGGAEPMAGSVRLLGQLAETHTIVYLTHRPDYFSLRSKRWLQDHGYPPGPVLLSTLKGFLKGSGVYKAEMLRELRERFRRIEIGIGDKVSDALAYHGNGLKTFLIVSVPKGPRPEPYLALAGRLADLPDEVHVVTAWSQIAEVLAGKAAYPPAAMRRRLRAEAEARLDEP